MNSYGSVINQGRSLDSSSMRTILKFDGNGSPYMKILNVPGVKHITAALENLSGQGRERPVIVAGDLSGMGEFNNIYGREAADEAIEKALEVFVGEFPSEEMSVGSPSGDEMWGVLTGALKTEEIIYRLTKVLKKMNGLDHRAGGDVVGLNAKFYVGRKSFAEVEKYLKYHPKTGKKLSPGVVVVEGALLNSVADVVIKPKEVSNEKIVRKAAQNGDRRDIEDKRRVVEKRHNLGTSSSEIKGNPSPALAGSGQVPEETRELTEREKEVFVDALKRESGLYPARFGFVFEVVKKLVNTFPRLRRLPDGVEATGVSESHDKIPRFTRDKFRKTEKRPQTPSAMAPMAGESKISPKENGLIYVNNMKLLNAADAAGIFYELKNHDREKFITLMLDSDDKILAAELVSIGTLNASLVHPREVFKIPLNLGAKKVVLVHNHPSGDVKPSREDIALTKRLTEVSKALDIEIKFHVVIGDDKYTALFANGDTEEGELKKTPEVYPVVRYEGTAIVAGRDEKMTFPDAIHVPADAVRFVRPLFKNDEPSALAVFMDSRNMVVSVDLIDPALDEASQRRIVRLAITSNAAGYILCANFDADDKKIKEMTRRGDLSGIEMLDFIILDKNSGLKSYVSKKAQGVIKEEKNIYDDGARDAVKEKTGYPSLRSGQVPSVPSGQGSVGKDFQWPENKSGSSINGESKSTKEAGAMIKVTDSAAKGSYVAKIVGTDEKYGVKREFLYTGLSWTKKKGVAELSIKPEDITAGDIIALKIVKTPEDGEAKEHFYRVVSEPSDNIALHSVVKKIPGGIEEVKKMLTQNGESASMSADEAGAENDDIFGKPDTPMFSDGDDGKADTESPFMGDDLIVNKGALRKSYVAVITGADDAGHLKRDFVSFYKDGALRVAASNVKQGDVVAMKIIRKEQKPGEAKECYYKIIKDPAEESEMHKVVQKITREDVVSLLAGKSAEASSDGGFQSGAAAGTGAETSGDDDPFAAADAGESAGIENDGQASSAGKARSRGRRM